MRGSPFLGSTIFRAGTRTEYQPAQLRTPPSSSYSASFSRIVDTRQAPAAKRDSGDSAILTGSPIHLEGRSYLRFTMAGAASAFSPSTPGGQTPLESVSSSIYPPEYIWNSLSEDQRASVISNISASFSLGDGSRKRARVDLTGEDDDTDAGRVPSTVIPVLPRFPGLDRAAIIAIFEHSFRPKKDLIKLRSPEFKAVTLDNESFDLKSTSSGLQFRKVVSVKDWGNDASLWSHCFHNYIAVWASFFNAQHPSCIIGMILFHRRICDLARTYKWQDCILQLALDKHQMIIDKGDLAVSLDDWRLEPVLESSYLRPDNILPTKANVPAPAPRPTRSASAPNNDTVVCEKFNSPAGCSWRACLRRHVCSKCNNNHPAISCKIHPVK